MARKRISALIGDVDTIVINLRTRLDGGEVPLLADFQTELEGWLAEARNLESQQELYLSRLRDNTEQRRLAEARGVDLRSRAFGYLRGHFGPKAKVLLEFGFRPRRNPRPAKPEEEPTPETPALESPPGEAGSSG